MGRGHGLYWSCSCGRWTWASKSHCIGCKSPPPAWVQERRASTCHEATPGSGADDDGWVSAPRSKRGQAKARAAAAKVGADGTEQSPISVVSDGEPMDEHDAEFDDGTAPVTERLESAQGRVRELEAIGSHARAVIPDFDALLASAVHDRDQLLQEKKQQRPIQWRLVQAERLAKTKATQARKCSDALDGLRADLEALQCKLSEKELELQKLRHEQSSADAALAAVHSEIAAGCARPPVQVHSVHSDVLQVASGLSQQIHALPTAVRAGNGDAALEAVQKQLHSLLGSLEVPGFDPGEGESHTLLHGLPASVPPTSTVRSGRRCTSPVRSERSASESSVGDGDERRRTRSPRPLTIAERAATESSRRLEDCGFQPKRPPASNDPYEDAAEHEPIGAHSVAGRSHG